VGDIIGRAQRAEDIARFQAGRGTRRTRGKCGVLHRHKERLALDVRKREVHAARVAAFWCRGTIAEDVGAAGGYALDEALGEGRGACVVVLVRVRVSYASAKAISRGGVGGRSQYPCTQAHRRVECDTQQKGAASTLLLDWRINTVRVQVLITVSPALPQPHF
jgi:hypothetical protein